MIFITAAIFEVGLLGAAAILTTTPMFTVALLHGWVHAVLAAATSLEVDLARPSLV